MPIPDGEQDASPPSQGPILERILTSLGFRRLADLGPGQWGVLVWFAVFVVCAEVFILQGYNVLIGRPIGLAQNPVRILELGVVVGAAVAVQALRTRYQAAVELSHLRERATNPQKFHYLVPDRLTVALVTVGVIFTLANAFFVLGIEYLYEIGGPARVVRLFVVIPFGYVPVIATAFGAYMSAEVLVPRRIENSGVSLDYLDPENLGGIRHIGELVKFAYYIAMVGLIAYAVATYGPHVVQGPLGYEALKSPGALTNAAFTTAWVTTVGAMVYGIYVLHRYMAREKRADLHEVERTAREEFGRQWDIEEINIADPPPAYEEYRKQVELIASTREYPAKFTMWTQLLVGVLIPKVIQVGLRAI